jgi:cell wall-associated NlpC family hydrolase
VLFLSAAALVAAPSALSEPSAIAAKRAEVEHVLGEIQELDGSLERAIEAYNLATDKLHKIQADLRVNLHELNVARSNLKHSQRALATRLIALYTSQGDTSTLGILLGAGNMADLLGQVDTANRVSNQDVQIHDQVITFKGEIQRRRVRLKNSRARQREVVQERADAKASIESQLAERRQLVSSIRQEIERMKAEEARRQAELARQARERAATEAAAPPTIVSNPTAPSPAAAPAPPPAAHGDVVSIAMQYLGVPYVWGGASPSGFDCSGFTMYVYAQVGVSLPHNAAAQYGMGSPVSMGQLQAGDLVFFYGLGHVGIYIGGGQFIHSPHTGDVVKISSMSGWYSSNFVGGRRL